MTLLPLLLDSTGLTQKQAADYLGVSVDTVESWSCGRRRMSQDAVNALLALMDRQAVQARVRLDAVAAWQPIGQIADPAVLRRLIEIADPDQRLTIITSIWP